MGRPGLADSAAMRLSREYCIWAVHGCVDLLRNSWVVLLLLVEQVTSWPADWLASSLAS